MLNNSTTTYSVAVVATAIAAAISGELPKPDIVGGDLVLVGQTLENETTSAATGMPFLFYNHASEMVESTRNKDAAIRVDSMKMLLRFQAIEKSFSHNNDGFPTVKRSYFLCLANTVCRLPFVDNVSSYNNEDETIDTILKLAGGLTLSISQFLNDSEDAPVVFSIHRGKTLLVSDELPLSEVVGTILSVTDKA